MIKRFNVTAANQDPVVRANNGMVELRFPKSDCNSYSTDLPRLMGQLKCSFITDDVLERCILQFAVKNQTQVVLLVFLPEAGEFGLEVYANDPQKDGSSYFAVSPSCWFGSSL